MKIIFPWLAVFAHSSYLFSAEEFTVELGEFRKEVIVEASTVPTDFHELRIDPKRWSKFQIRWLAPHGTKVLKGEKVVLFEFEPYQKALKEASSKRVAQRLELKTLEAELQSLEENRSLELAAIALKEERGEEDHDYFFRVTRPEAAKDARMALQQSEQYLSYQEEELEQLFKMYQADDLTEETEEIILIRAKNRVEEYKRRVEKAKLKLAFVLTVQLERESQDQVNKLKSLKLKTAQKRKELDLVLEKKKQKVVEARRQGLVAEEELGELKEDRKLLAYYAPTDGIVYYGSFSKGLWRASSAQKLLEVGQMVPVHKPLVNIVSKDTGYDLVGEVKEDVAHYLSTNEAGACWWLSEAWKAKPVRLKHLSRQYNQGGKFTASFTSSQPILNLFPRKQAEVKVLCYQADSVMKVPLEYLSKTGRGNVTVNLKMAEGEPRVREVVVGEVNDHEAEILSGIDPGQVLLK